MKKITCLLFFSLTGCILIANAQSGKEAQVAKTINALTMAMLHPEKKTLEPLMSEDLSYGHSAGLVQNKADFIEGIINGPFRFLTIDITDQTIKILKDIAIVRQKMSCDYSDNNGRGKLNFGVLMVWRREGGQWKLLARQAIKV